VKTLGSSRLSLALAALVLAALLLAPAAAQASFGFLPGEEGFNVTATAEGGEVANTVAGSHPYSLVTEANFNLAGKYSDGDLRNLSLDLPPGLVENPTAVSRCQAATFATPRSSPFEAPSLSGEDCPDTSQIGIVTLKSSFNGGETRSFGVFNLVPPTGAPSQFGFSPYGVPVTVTPHVREAGREYGLTLDLENLSQQIGVTGFRLVIWGNPWAISHNGQRGDCLNEEDPGFAWAKCPIAPLKPSHAAQAYLTLPTSCEGPLSFHATATSWQQPTPVHTSASAAGLEDCDTVPFNPTGQGLLTTDRTTSTTGFVFSLEGNSAALLNPTAQAASQAKTAVVTLAEGMTINPSVASGLSTCSEAQFAAETVTSAPGAGCPQESKIGKLMVESPILEGRIEGSIFIAVPRENRFGTLLALYLVAKAPQRGIMVKVAGKVVSDPATGRITATFDDLPQLPYSHLDVELRQGQRSPLATPAACGPYATGVDTSPWRDPSFVKHQDSPFSLAAGVGGGPCPQGAVAPFHPGAIGGTLNSNASAYTPFYLHLTRADPEQEITSYSATLPPGLLGKLAGVPFCPEAEIAAAKAQSGAASATTPACPAASQIGRTYTGYGVGGTLAYAPGTLYLAGPYHGSPLSVVAIDSAKVGPFDLGTVVIRSAIRIDRQTAQVAIDSAGSDPIPHILDGFPLRLRDIRIYIDRPRFTINPTSCNPFSLSSTLTGAGARFSDPADDRSSTALAPFQVLNCSALGFAPRFALLLRGGHKRGDFPGLRATVAPFEGDANLAKATVTLPPKLFLAQEHLDTVCTPRQFAAKACPKGSIYGRATALTPLLDEPMTGPVYLRSNGDERPLPDLVAALSGRGIEIDVVGKIDSYKGGLRARFDVLPDAPVSKFTMNLRGGKKGIFANATDVCANPQIATAKFSGQDNATETLRVPMKANCGAKKKKGKRGSHKAKGGKSR
jgi:hypothetical protein